VVKWDGREGGHPQKGNWRMSLMMSHEMGGLVHKPRNFFV